MRNSFFLKVDELTLHVVLCCVDCCVQIFLDAFGTGDAPGMVIIISARQIFLLMMLARLADFHADVARRIILQNFSRLPTFSSTCAQWRRSSP